MKLRSIGSFITNITTDANDMTIVQSLIYLAERLGVTVVAEGIESQQTLDLLTELGCGVAQGYHIARPMPAQKLPDWIRKYASSFAAAAGGKEPLPRRSERGA